VPWQSWLAVDHEVTAEQWRPSDVEMVSSLLMTTAEKAILGFLEPTAYWNPQKINANVYNVAEKNW
jgi:hypothetical protein